MPSRKQEINNTNVEGSGRAVQNVLLILNLQWYTTRWINKEGTKTGLCTLIIDWLPQPHKFTLNMDDLKLLSAEVGVPQHPWVLLSGFCLYRKVAY